MGIVIFLVSAHGVDVDGIARWFETSGMTLINPIHWLREQSAIANDPRADPLAHYILHNYNQEVLTPVILQYIEQSIDTHQASGVVFSGFPATPADARALPRLCRGKPCQVIEVMIPGKERHDLELITAELHSGVYMQVNGYGRTDESIFEQICASLTPQRMPVNPPTFPPPFDGSADARTREVIAIFRPVDAFDTARVVMITIQLAESTRTKHTFCGTHPVSLHRKHLEDLKQYPYHVSLKADGVRFFCLVWRGFLWFINRRLEVMRSDFLDNRLDGLEYTLVDGEFVLPNMFLVLDGISDRGCNIMHHPLVERMNRTTPLGKIMCQGPQVRFAPQEYVDKSRLSELNAKAPDRPFKLDGLVFTPSQRPYILGINRTLFKWKPPEQNTVDLVYQKVNGEGVLFVRERGGEYKLREWAYVHCEAMLPEGLKDGDIVECVPDPAYHPAGMGIREIVKIRYDKRFPNLDWVANDVLQSLQEPVSFDDLLMACNPPSILPDRPLVSHPDVSQKQRFDQSWGESLQSQHRGPPAHRGKVFDQSRNRDHRERRGLPLSGPPKPYPSFRNHSGRGTLAEFARAPS